MRDDILAKYDIGTRHPLLDAIRRAFGQIHESQRLSQHEIRQKQLSLAATLVEFASEEVPLYRDLYGGPTRISTWAEFCSLPFLERAVAADATISTRKPQRTFGLSAPLTETSTSGTTGKKVVTSRSLKFEVWRAACRLLEYEWAAVDPRGSCLLIRSDERTLDSETRRNPRGERLRCWEEPLLEGLMPFGFGLEFPIGAKEESIVGALHEHKMDYISTTPTMLESMIPSLNGYTAKTLLTIGETLSEETRLRISEAYSCPVFDAYGTRETGRVAAQCPACNGYHVHDLNVLVELIDDSGRPIEPGETGHVLITSLHNYAMPMIRYRVGDLAVKGAACPCGRELSFIERFEGREVNRILLRGGRKRISRSVSKHLQKIETIHAFQVRQKSYDRFELVLDGSSFISERDLQETKRLLEELVEETVQLTLTRVDSLPPLPSGKRTRFLIDFEPEKQSPPVRN